MRLQSVGWAALAGSLMAASNAVQGQLPQPAPCPPYVPVMTTYYVGPIGVPDGAYEPCVYPPPQTCDDPEASNYGSVGDCVYPPPPPDVCEDPYADNYGGPPPCLYPPPPPDVCEDPGALNYGDAGGCVYDTPDDPPPPDPWAGGDPDDPCYWDPFSVECTGDIYAMSVARGGERQSASIAVPAKRGFYVVMLDKWSDASVVAMVGRYWHAGHYVDAIYISSRKPNALGWLLANRALREARRDGGKGAQLTRVIRIRTDGGQSFSAGGRSTASQKKTALPSEAVLRDVERELSATVTSHLPRLKARGSKKSGAMQMLKIRG